MKTICDTEKCYGCCACYNICPANAVSMSEDNWGNIIPLINQEKCIDCGMCQKVCPAINASDFKKPKHTFAAISKNDDIYSTTTSGGVATAMSKFVLENGGIVYGAAFVNNTSELKHVRVDSLDELENLKGSKYVQSKVGLSFRQVKADLIDRRFVIFIGTPCQIDGLINYLEKDYTNLITVNLICHGVPSNKLLTEHIESLVKNNSADDLSVSFRGENSFKLILTVDDEKIYESPFNEDNYFLGFMRKLFYRECCYSCKYAQQNRVGDFTIGDFWGFDKRKPFPAETNDGLSVILVNTDKGKNFFDKVSNELIYQQRNLQEAVDGNPQLKHPSTKNHNFEKFRRLYIKYGFEKAAKKTLSIYKFIYRVIFLLQSKRK